MSFFFNQKEEPGAGVEKNRTEADEKLVTLQESLKARGPPVARNESQMEVEHGEDSHVEYTELTLDCLDLKAQEELLSPPLSGDKSISLTDLAFHLRSSEFIISPFSSTRHTGRFLGEMFYEIMGCVCVQV